jgi:hypothetical protein
LDPHNIESVILSFQTPAFRERRAESIVAAEPIGAWVLSAFTAIVMGYRKASYITMHK